MAITFSPAALGHERASAPATDTSRVAVIDAFTSLALLPFTVLLAVMGAIVSVVVTGGTLNPAAATSVEATAAAAVIVWIFSAIAPLFSAAFALESIRHGGTRASQTIALGSLSVSILILAIFTITQLLP
jgi:hypothetical protein